MFFWNSLAFSMIQWILAFWSLVPLPFLKPAWMSGRVYFKSPPVLAQRPWNELQFCTLPPPSPTSLHPTLSSIQHLASLFSAPGTWSSFLPGALRRVLPVTTPGHPTWLDTCLALKVPSLWWPHIFSHDLMNSSQVPFFSPLLPQFEAKTTAPQFTAASPIAKNVQHKSGGQKSFLN